MFTQNKSKDLEEMVKEVYCGRTLTGWTFPILTIGSSSLHWIRACYSFSLHYALKKLSRTCSVWRHMLDSVTSDGRNLPSEVPALQRHGAEQKCISSLLFLKLQENAAKNKKMG